MLTKLRLERFKNFQEAELNLGSFTLIVGTNASGKSNIRDAFRFLHGISRGYSIPGIIGEKWGEGGVIQWSGIRGGAKEIAFNNSDNFILETMFSLEESNNEMGIYTINIKPNANIRSLRILDKSDDLNIKIPILEEESIKNLNNNSGYFKIKSLYEPKREINIDLPKDEPISKEFIAPYTDNHSVLAIIASRALSEALVKTTQAAISNFSSMRFLDLNPDAMRQPSIPGQTILGDRGENLSSVLYDICADTERKQTLLQWIQELTPMDAVDFEFPADFTGRILLHLVERNGQRISAISASDGTLRFLAIIAALLGSEPAKFYFIEEIDNGIHPTRLHLLLQLIESQVAKGKIQIVATTHSPQLLRLLSPQSLEYAALTYRLPNRPDAKIKRILDIPEAKRVIEKQDLARLYESGWLEDAVEFLEDEDEERAE